MRLMSHYRDMGAVGFIGLEHTCVQEATLAAAWNMPLISYVSSLYFPLVMSTFRGKQLSCRHSFHNCVKLRIE
jgi:hypothetical protein